MSADPQPEFRDEPSAIKVQGRLLEQLPEDLYIPPDALRVVLEAFEGPLDLLLYLIRRQNLDILDIPVQHVAEQYIAYIELMRDLEIELAGEYLLMAAMLAEIKSRLLLPRPAAEDEEGGDPRAELVRRLQEYERFKNAGEALDELPRAPRDFVPVQLPAVAVTSDIPKPQPELRELLQAFSEVMQRAEFFAHHQVEREPLSVRERMSGILAAVQGGAPVAFSALFPRAEGRMGVVVTLVAILELARAGLVELVQVDGEPLQLRRPGAHARRGAADDVLMEDEAGV